MSSNKEALEIEVVKSRLMELKDKSTFNVDINLPQHIQNHWAQISDEMARYADIAALHRTDNNSAVSIAKRLIAPFYRRFIRFFLSKQIHFNRMILVQMLRIEELEARVRTLEEALRVNSGKKT